MMTTPDEPTRAVRFSRDVPIVDQVDVLVIGGGPAGIGAALGAARANVSTALVEQYGFLGGAATAGLVGPFMTSFSRDGARPITGGVFDELVRRMASEGGAIHPESVRSGTAESGFYVFGHDHVTPFDSEVLKRIAAEMMIESSVKLWLHTRFIAPIMEGSWLRGAIVHSKSGLQAIAARVVIDCSADADVAYGAGAPTLIGRDLDGLTQPMSMFFQVGNVDDDQVIAYAQAHPDEEGRLFHSIVEQAKREGRFKIARDKVGIYRSVEPGVWRVNTSRMQELDGTNVHDLTQAEIIGRRQVAELMCFFHASLPGFKEATLLSVAVQVGIRETRRIVGDYVLTMADLHKGHHFEDTIALGSFPVDLHPETGDGGGTDTGLERGFTTAPIYEIPYRSLVPQKVEQLLVAGRCISGEREALAAVRIMPVCFSTGQAAGVGAAVSVLDETSPRMLNTTKVQRILGEQGAFLN